jgi:hypothetical protein
MVSIMAAADDTSNCPVTNKDIAEVLISAKLGYTKIDVPPSEYKSDGDPDTLEIVVLTEPGDGPSRVSDDGEVIYVSKATLENTKKEMPELYRMAAYRKAVLKRNLTKECRGPWPYPPSGLTNRSSGRGDDKVPSPIVGARAAQLNR